MLSVLSISAALLWLAILLLPWRPWSTREVLEEGDSLPVPASGVLDDVTVLIPARNEAETIQSTLQGLVRQGSPLKVIVIDDQSDDGTTERARAVAGLPNLDLVQGAALPDGWTGKLWALEQGLERVTTRYTLLLDADITLEPGVLAGMLVKIGGDAKLVSVMASLRMQGPWERLLLPAFIYFFRMIYPFHLANSADRRFAAAAGGCILLETEALRSVGGFASIRDAVIDDCTLAKRFKDAGYRTWIGLSRRVTSQRRYERLEPIWEMVARTAYTQLRYSPVYLILCTVLMLLLYWVPLVALLAPAPPQLPAIIACIIMFFVYLPTLRFYELNAAWGLAQPVIAALYLAMAWSSAWRYRAGVRSRWKGRVYR